MLKVALSTITINCIVCTVLAIYIYNTYFFVKNKFTNCLDFLFFLGTNKFKIRKYLGI